MPSYGVATIFPGDPSAPVARRHPFANGCAQRLQGTIPLEPWRVESLERDGGDTIGFVRTLARRGGSESLNLLDPSIGVRFGVD